MIFVSHLSDEINAFATKILVLSKQGIVKFLTIEEIRRQYNTIDNFFNTLVVEYKGDTEC